MRRGLHIGLLIAVALGGAAAAQTFQSWVGPASEQLPGVVITCPTGSGRQAAPCGTTGNPLQVTMVPTDGAGGVASFSRMSSSAAGSNVTVAKASAGRAYVYQGCNTTASTIYMRVYNTATAGAVTVGTTTPFAGPYAFPANTCLPPTTFAANIGIYTSAGLTYAFGTSPADSDATPIGAGALTAFQLGFQ